MKSAKEMFENLGYKLISYGDEKIIQYRINMDNNNFRDIVFNIKNKNFWYGDTRNTYFYGYLRKEHNFVATDMFLLQAINQQCKELGWLEDK